MRPAHAAIFVFALLFLSSFASAKYTEWLNVQVFDKQFRTVEGAQVYARHELNSVTGFVNSKPKLTNSTGEALITFTDYEAIPEETDPSYTLFVKYGNTTNGADLIVGNYTQGAPRVYSFLITANYLVVRATDHVMRPINGTVTVTARGIPNFAQTKDVDAVGKAAFHLPPGNYDVRFETPSFSKVENVDVNVKTGDRNLDLMVGLYPMDITVIDDARNPLNATVEVGERAYVTDARGKLHVDNITEASPNIKVKYGKMLKRIKPQLNRQSGVEVVFDLNKPVIKELYVSVSQAGVGTLTLFAEDVGKSASGIENVAVVYDVGGTGGTVQTYTVGYNSFETKIPAQLSGSFVKYTVTVTDKEGNFAVGSGSYSIPEEIEEIDTGPVKKQESGISLEGLLVGVVAFGIAVYGAIYYLNKKKEEEEAAAESPYKDKEKQPPKIPPNPPYAQQKDGQASPPKI